MLKRFAILVSALALFILQSQSVFACGGLVAPNGAIRLSRATTLVAWHNGIEHYLTSFTYQETNTNSVANVGLMETSQDADNFLISCSISLYLSFGVYAIAHRG